MLLVIYGERCGVGELNGGKFKWDRVTAILFVESFARVGALFLSRVSPIGFTE
jgi:hypothetical protein